MISTWLTKVDNEQSPELCTEKVQLPQLQASAIPAPEHCVEPVPSV